MPLHDWTDERGWDSVDPFWLAYLVEWIQPRLPEGYKAFLGGVPALTVASGNGKPDVSVRQWGPGPPAEEVATDTAVLEPDLEASVAVRLDPQPAVHIDFHGQLIAAVELVSPRNKDRADAKEDETAIDVVAYAAQIAAQMGAHIIKVKLPTDHIANTDVQKLYAEHRVSTSSVADRVKHVVQSTFDGRRIVIFSGGAKKDDAALLDDVRAIRDGGGFGSIIGRNAFQRPKEQAVDLLRRIMAIYAER